jgi:hypothetical protein
MKRNGSLAGIPYDTRRPTAARVKFTYWSADNPRFFPPKVDGLGWGINFFWLVHPFRWLKVRRVSPPTPGAPTAGSVSHAESITN